MSSSFISRSRNEELNRYARTSLVLSLVGIFLWVILFIPQIVSIVLGIKALECENRNQAITGIAISGVTVVFAGVLAFSLVPMYLMSVNKLDVDQEVNTIELVEMVEEELKTMAVEEIDLDEEIIPEAAVPEDLSMRSFTGKGISLDIGYPLGWEVLDGETLKQLEDEMDQETGFGNSFRGRPLIKTGAVQVPVPAGEYAGSVIVSVENFAEVVPGLTSEAYFTHMKAEMSQLVGHIIYSEVGSYAIDGKDFSKISMSYNVGDYAIEQRVFCYVEEDIAVTVVCSYADYGQMEMLMKSVDSLEFK